METIIEWFLGAIGVVLLVVFTVFLVALGYDGFKSVKDGNGWVSQDRRGEAFTEIIKEEDGCVYYIDVYGSNSKACGSYVVKRY